MRQNLKVKRLCCHGLVLNRATPTNEVYDERNRCDDENQVYKTARNMERSPAE